MMSGKVVSFVAPVPLEEASPVRRQALQKSTGDVIRHGLGDIVAPSSKSAATSVTFSTTRALLEEICRVTTFKSKSTFVRHCCLDLCA